MSRLMLDYFRRWRWVLLLVGLLEFKLGWSIAERPAAPFEWWAFLLALWAGAILLNFDLLRGALRPVAVLPLPARKIGRSWWVATVPLPALGLAALLFLGAGTFCQFHAARSFPVQQLVMASLFTLVWQGIEFTLIFNATRGLGGSGWEFVCNFFIGLLSAVTFFGSLLLAQGASKSALRSAILLGVGGFLTAVGWVRTGEFNPGRAWLYLGHPGQVDSGALLCSGAGQGSSRLTPLEPRIVPGHRYTSVGYGGMAFLLSTSFVRMFLYVAGMLTVMALLSLVQPQPLPRSLALSVFGAMGSYMACGFIIVFQILPILRQLRFLRTLPVSLIRLAAVLLSVMLLPLFSVGTLATAVAWQLIGTPTALILLNCFTFILAPASLCVFLAVWRGEGILPYSFLFITIFGFQKLYDELQLHLHSPQVPFRVVGLIVAAALVLASLLTYLALRYSSHAYRVRTSPLGSLPWGAGR